MGRSSVDDMRLGHTAPQRVQTTAKLGYHTAGNDFFAYESLRFFFRKTRYQIAGSIEHSRDIRQQDELFSGQALRTMLRQQCPR